ncbi:tyrosine-type recombinase/integrase [Pseudonocardia sp. S2-4]|uniref:Tyrosine-type recombinase/integrase n=1 Tax=Pseudonocardia humida TaxID=2800819 RepID=A0ABT1ADD4_9PSEU|nr:tyrosine-type recombinase/integrase [Pseudonocardia humida]
MLRPRHRPPRSRQPQPPRRAAARPPPLPRSVPGTAEDSGLAPDNPTAAGRRRHPDPPPDQFPIRHPDRLLFTDNHGNALRRTRFSREIWRPTVTAVGARHGTGFHDLRHYYASLLIRHGESVKTVQRRLGHATAAETLDTYARLWPDSDERTREAIDSVLRSSRHERSAAQPSRASQPGPAQSGPAR